VPYLAKSSLENDFIIPINDLYLKVVNGRIVVLSKKYNTEVVFRLDNAHNYSNSSLPIYRFLCDIQNQGSLKGMYFSWGRIPQENFFTPRATYKNCILALATWHISKKMVKDIFDSKPFSERKIKLFAFFQKHKIPKKILFTESDNELYIDLNKPDHIEMFLDLIEKRSEFILKEFIFDSNKSVVIDKDDNSYTNEIVLSINNTK